MHYLHINLYVSRHACTAINGASLGGGVNEAENVEAYLIKLMARHLHDDLPGLLIYAWRGMMTARPYNRALVWL